MSDVDLLVVGLDELATPIAEPPFVGEAMGDVRVIEDAAIAFRGETIAHVGTEAELSDLSADHRFDADGGTLVPGFVDAHTHLVWAGDRARELSMKLEGISYEEILAAGGGIHSTVQATRDAGTAELAAASRRRLDRCLALGTTTMEAKSGYALTPEGELRLLQVLQDLDEEHPVDIVPTLLGAHAIPKQTDREAYVEQMIDELTPRVAKQGLAEFCDAFVDKGAFTVEEGRRILEAGKASGLDVRVHADELARTGATRMGAGLNAQSLDHLNRVDEEDIATLAGAVEDGWSGLATLCPVTPFTSAIPYAPARELIDAGVPVALGSDLNPNAWSEGMGFTISLAVHGMRMRPGEVLTAATANAAASVNRFDRGRLQVGLRGDAVLLDLPSYEHLGYRMGDGLVKTVVKNGRPVA